MSTKRELLARIRELEEENESLQEQLDDIADIIALGDDDTDEVQDDDEE